MPHSIRSMLATLSEGVINNEQYLYEVKWDGYRITAYVQKTKVRLESWAD
ncbi:hypothetical protein [Longitalea luteola]|nr:hypothetical protein [Longitalea luteola]